MQVTKRILIFLFVNIALIFGATLNSYAQEGEINIYSTLNFPQFEKLLTDFSEETGIRVNRFDIEDNDLLKMQKEGLLFGEVDVFLTSGIQNLLIASEIQVFDELNLSRLQEVIPNQLRDEQGKWFAYSYWPRVIIYNKSLIDPLDTLTYESLSDPKLEHMVCVGLSSYPSNLSLLASIIENIGEENARSWALGFRSNFSKRPQGGDTDQILSVLTGECGVALIDYTYFLRMFSNYQFDLVDMQDKVGIIFPNQGDRGSFVNISGGGIFREAPNQENALKFLLYLSTLEPQKSFATLTSEYPVNRYVLADQNFKNFKPFKMDDLVLSILNDSFSLAKEISKEVGWK